MAQIIQYKDREKDTSVYPVTVGAAVYMDFNDTSVYQTLDDVMLVKPDSIILFDGKIDGSIDGSIIGYTYVPTIAGALDASVNINDKILQDNALQNLGIKELLHNLEVSVSNITSNYQNKQDRIVSFEHIKTINGVNIVGPGDVSIYINKNLIGIDSSLDEDSSNAIMNSTVSECLIWENISKENE